MRKYLGFLLVIVLIFGVVQVGNAVLITFDDISGNVEVTDQYAAYGINFQQTFELDSWDTSKYAPAKDSNDHIAYSKTYMESMFLFDNVIDYFSLLVTADPGVVEKLFLDAYDNSDNWLATTELTIEKSNEWYLMEIGLTGLSAQKIKVHDLGRWFAFDNITYTPIPEPCTFLLFCLGIIGFAWIKRKIRQ